MATVVVIDDDDFVRSFVGRLLELAGHDVLSFPDGQPALDQVKFDQVDLVLTDLQMETDGEVVIKSIRERGFQVPIVVMSGHVQPDEADRYVEMGAQSILIKPFTIQNFWKINGAWISSKDNQIAC